MSAAETKPQESPFWRFSLRFYREPQVADACIALQEEAGIDVNLLLFLLWHATQKHVLTAAEVAGLEARIGGWRDMTVIPLRNVRRALKSPPGLVEGGKAELFRTKIKAVELEAERLQQEALYDLAQTSRLGRPSPSRAEAARDSISSYQGVIGPFPPEPLEAVLSAFAKFAPPGSNSGA